MAVHCEQNVMRGFQSTRVVQRTRFQAKMVVYLAGLVIDSGATFRAKGICEDLSAACLPLKTLQLSG